jgi:hypothetical protein
VGHAAADPVKSDDARSGLGGGEASPTATLNLPAAVQVEPMPSAGDAKAVLPGGLQASSSPSAQALDIMREVRSGAAPAGEPQRAAKASARQPAMADPKEAANELDLRESAKAVLLWLKEAMPWTRKQADDDTARHVQDWRESVREDAQPQRNPAAATAQGADGPVAAQVRPGAGLGYDSNPRLQTYGAEQNVMREIVDIARIVLDHPMTWLVVALFVVGALVVSKFDRRPK